jgi:hypothetical protein
MKPARPIPIVAVVTDAERPIIEAAASLLASAMNQTDGSWVCPCSFAQNLDQPPGMARPSVIVTSLLPQLMRLDTPWAEVEGELRSYYEALSNGTAPVMICTILRHVPSGDDPKRADRIRRRVRKLNLLATELSRQYGAFIIDLDRVLADIGARHMDTDYRLGGVAAVDVASKAVALSIVVNALDSFASVEIQDAARAVIDSYRPAAALVSEFRPLNVIALGEGRRKQHVSTVIAAVQENQVEWLIRQVIKRQISFGQAYHKLIQAFRRRGARESATLLLSGIKRSLRAPT